MQAVIALLVGLIFGAGLILAGMANPAKVQGFLDLFGAWDPSLALVMVGAIAITSLGFAAAMRMKFAYMQEPPRMPESRGIDARLALGSVVFGVGWGMAGFCPGPALVALGAGEAKAAVFTLAMLAGMAIYEALERRPRVKQAA
jgi:uncharacterized membrane protein YedE/YeeE